MHQKSMNRFKMCFSGLSVSDSELHSAVLFIPPVAQPPNIYVSIYKTSFKSNQRIDVFSDKF